MLMERFPHKIGLVVFLAAVVLPSGVAFLQVEPLLALLDLSYIAYNFKDGTQSPLTSLYVLTSDLQRFFYNGLDTEIVVLASKLVRPFPYLIAEPIAYAEERFGQVPTVCIMYLQDHTLPPAASEYIATHYGPFRELVTLDGGHFNFLQRPKEFTKLLERLAKKYTK